MTDRPFLFSAPMIRALLAGTKTQTRRLAKPQPPKECGINYMLGNESWLPVERRSPVRRAFEAWGGDLYARKPQGHLCGLFYIVPRIQPGDRLWVREAWAISTFYDGVAPRDLNPERVPNWCGIRFAATDERFGIKDRPSIFMPRWASRLTLYVTDVRVERLQDITLGDICAEGLAASIYDFRPVQRGFDAWISLWDSINGAGSWDANPWVAAYTFVPRRGNIDTLPATLEEAA